ncbi:MAG: sugar phosphate isomerase/epimerase [Kiritimatiellae bacterium]|nr:sugar phosphate isomerase/epimerase [Kiritimatiellia bacterium]
MYFTGFADEAAAGIDGQISATKELGWSAIESRAVDGVNIHDLPDDKFDEVADKLAAAGVGINCFGSTIANWGKSVESEADFEKDLEQTERAIRRMLRLGTKLVRVMSYAVIKDRPPEDQMKEVRFERLRAIVGKFLAAGIQPVHENCMNYGGMGWSYTLEILDNVPGIKLVFDTGNPVFTADRTKPEPWPMQDPWEFYRAVADHVVYVHVKDGKMVDGKMHYTYPDEGSLEIQEIFDDLAKRGYDGGISIEPHLVHVFHDPSGKPDPVRCREAYIEYGRRTERMMREALRRAGRA